MAETIIENQICNSCGTDTRKGALFCYHCGGSVAPEIAVPKTDKIGEENQDLIKEGIVKTGKKISRNKLKNRTENESAPLKEIVEKPISKPADQPEKALKSAASLRKKSKLIQKKKVEIIWEEHENAPNARFILATVLLTLFTLGILWLALSFV